MPGKHLLYGGSSATRFKNCHGWAGLIQRVPRRPVGMAAHEGTAQHTCMERLLEDPDLTPEKFLGTRIMTEGGEITIRPEHVEAIQIALHAWEEIEQTFGENSMLFSEQFVVLGGDPDDPREDRGGTLDSGITDGKRAAIIDFKFGQIEVEATSDQNLFYMICARRTFPEKYAAVEQWESYIIQPALDPAVDKVVYPTSVLDRFEQEILTAIDISRKPGAPFVPGEWCDWCDAKLACPAWTQQLSTLTLPTHAMSLPEIGKFLLVLKSLDKWREEATERMHHELEHGVSDPNWKLVNKRFIRQWANEAAIVAEFKKRKITQERYLETSVISPAKADKILPADVVKKHAVPVSSGTTIAPMSDKRQAVMPTQALAQALKGRR